MGKPMMISYTIKKRKNKANAGKEYRADFFIKETNV
jgi:hypothetical protein